MLRNSNRDARDSNCIIGHVRILYNRVNAMASGSGESSRRNRSDVWQYFKKEETEGSRMLFVPFVRVSLLSMAARQICGTTCKEAIPPFPLMILDSPRLIR